MQYGFKSTQINKPVSCLFIPKIAQAKRVVTG